MHVLYVSITNGVHDDRWIEAMRSSGCTVTSLQVDPEGDEARSRVISLTTELGIDIMVAGPLTTCTSHLVDLDVPLVGLSWGFDLHEMVDVYGVLLQASDRPASNPDGWRSSQFDFQRIKPRLPPTCTHPPRQS